MFISLSRTLHKFCGARCGLGIRITKKNIWWMWLVLMYVYIFKAMRYMLVMCFWMVYAVCYGLLWCIRAPFRLLRRK